MSVEHPTWDEDCMRWYGYVLTGRHRHWCPDWDYLPIDETQDEFKCCTCDFCHDPDCKECRHDTDHSEIADAICDVDKTVVRTGA